MEQFREALNGENSDGYVEVRRSKASQGATKRAGRCVGNYIQMFCTCLYVARNDGGLAAALAFMLIPCGQHSNDKVSLHSRICRANPQLQCECGILHSWQAPEREGCSLHKAEQVVGGGSCNHYNADLFWVRAFTRQYSHMPSIAHRAYPPNKLCLMQRPPLLTRTCLSTPNVVAFDASADACTPWSA